MKEKDLYVSPLCETLELHLEGVIAQSGLDTAPGFPPTFDPPFGGGGGGGEEEWFMNVFPF